MAKVETLILIKSDLGITNNSRDRTITGLIDECKADLVSCGVIYTTSESDPHIYGAIRLFVMANIAESQDIRDRWMNRYNSKKEFLMLIEGYGYESGENDV